MTSTATHRPDATLVVRHATAADAAALRDLASLDSARPLAGPAVLAELDGRLVAAVSVADGRAVADPLVPTAAVLDAARAYAARSRTVAARARRSPWSRPPQRRHLQAAA